jgi:hypothetical protein
LDLDRYEPETGSVIPYPSYPDPRIGDLRAVSAPEDEERVTVASSFALQERRAQLERLADIARSKLARVEWDADELESLERAERSTLIVNRVEAWAAVRQALATDFFTDDTEKIDTRRNRVQELEQSLDALSRWDPSPSE